MCCPPTSIAPCVVESAGSVASAGFSVAFSVVADFAAVLSSCARADPQTDAAMPPPSKRQTAGTKEFISSFSGKGMCEECQYKVSWPGCTLRMSSRAL
jgi:hypothetical protein